MVDHLPSDSFLSLPNTWLNYQKTINDATNKTHTFKLQGVDLQNQDMAIRIYDILFSPVFASKKVSSTIPSNWISNKKFIIPQLAVNS